MNGLRSLKLPIGAMALAPLLIAVVLTVGKVLPDPTGFAAREVAIAAALALLPGLVGYFMATRLVQPLDSRADGESQPAAAEARIASAGYVAAAVAEGGFMLVVAVCFVGGFGGGALLVAAPIAALATYFAAFPSNARIGSLKPRLESAGGRSGL